MALTPRALVWAVQRLFVRSGALAWATLMVGLILCIQLVLIGMRLSTLAGMEANGADVVLPTERLGQVEPEAPTLPGLGERFRITDAALAQLLPDDAPVAAVRLEYQTRVDAGLTRQTITYTTQARWDALAPLLDSLQAVDRSIYIGRLQLRRELPEVAELEAEVQLSAVYMDAVDTEKVRAESP